MRLLTGGTLAERVAQREAENRPLPSLGEVSLLLSQLAGAFDYAHSRGVIHRDIKPSNIMFDNQGNAFLVDFGIAKLLSTTSALTGTGMMLGTPLYMAPEQWRAEPPTAATDQYALGVTIYQLLTGHVPFEAPTPFGLMHKHLNETPTPLHIVRSDLPEAVTITLQRALAKNPADRFPTVTAFAQSFEQSSSGSTGETTQFLTFPVKRLPPVPPTGRPSTAQEARIGGIYSEAVRCRTAGTSLLPASTGLGGRACGAACAGGRALPGVAGREGRSWPPGGTAPVRHADGDAPCCQCYRHSYAGGADHDPAQSHADRQPGGRVADVDPQLHTIRHRDTAADRDGHFPPDGDCAANSDVYLPPD